MKNNKFGVIAKGVKLPIIKEGDNLRKIVVDYILKVTSRSGLHKVEYDLNDKDVIGITESIVARSQGNYVTIDEIVQDIKSKVSNLDEVAVLTPIYSRNRFSLILKAFARTFKNIYLYLTNYDEVGNLLGINPFTGINIEDYYQSIIQKEEKNCVIYKDFGDIHDLLLTKSISIENIIYCGLHDYKYKKECFGREYKNFLTLADICSDKCLYGLLGSNKATDEKLKLFPKEKESIELVNNIQEDIYNRTGKKVEVMIYGDGCFHSPKIEGVCGSSIWEFADPVVSPAYTKGLEGTPNEIKIKAFADNKYKNLQGKELDEAIKNEIKEKKNNLIGNMDSQGTTPRQYNWLLCSLMDLISGSGDKGTPVVLVQNYFNNFAN